MGNFVGKYEVCDTGHNPAKDWSTKDDSVSIYEKVSHIRAVKFIPFGFCNGHSKYYGLVFPRIGLEYKIKQIDFLSEKIYSEYLAVKRIIISLEQIQMELGSVIPVSSISNVKYGGLVTNGYIYSLWEGIWQEGVQ